jgi:hypothetical protein
VSFDQAGFDARLTDSLGEDVEIASPRVSRRTAKEALRKICAAFKARGVEMSWGQRRAVKADIFQLSEYDATLILGWDDTVDDALVRLLRSGWLRDKAKLVNRRRDEAPRRALFLLTLLPGDIGDAIIGDLEEAYPKRVERFGRRAARFWCWWHAIRSIVGYYLRKPVRPDKDDEHPHSVLELLSPAAIVALQEQEYRRVLRGTILQVGLCLIGAVLGVLKSLGYLNLP